VLNSDTDLDRKSISWPVGSIYGLYGASEGGLRPERGLITQGKPEAVTSHVILNEIHSDWGDPVEVLDVKDSEVFDDPNAFLADRRF